MAHPIASLSWANDTVIAVAQFAYSQSHNVAMCDTRCTLREQMSVTTCTKSTAPIFQMMKSLTDLSVRDAKDKVTDHAANAQNHSPYRSPGLTTPFGLGS